MKLISPDIADQNVQHFKFQSQHFHKFFAATSGLPERRGIKALDRYSRMLGFEDFNDAHSYLTRQTKKIKSFPIPSREAILRECSDYSGDPAIISLVSNIYQFYFYVPQNAPNSRQLYNKSFRKMESFTQFPMKNGVPLWESGDSLAVAVARYLGASELQEKMLSGIFIVLFDLFEKDAISGFSFHDVIELLQPEVFLDTLKRYGSLSHQGSSAASWVHTKISRHCSKSDLEKHRNFFLDAFSSISRGGVTVNPGTDGTIFDRALDHLAHAG
jgi:hypothetical protein